ncbi:tyrosine-protein phosphatase 69D-like [Neodiprion fabricii]|uniref:tyrosine-protein phosphatase 69D-like n=1 Tax=Neodiprion fabricii TaxID=2872261 RepID=UPI001ED941A8|nr:tyrosine-protein phosphatase 69D-like [Neodiprion fabricii]
MSRSNLALILKISSLLACFILIQRVADAKRIVSAPKTVEVEKNGMAELTCNVEGYAEDDVTWIKPNDHRNLKGRIDPFGGKDRFTTTLTVKNVKDDGVYQCLTYDEILKRSVGDNVTVKVISRRSSQPDNPTYSDGLTVTLTPYKQGGAKLEWRTRNAILPNSVEFVSIECNATGITWQNCGGISKCPKNQYCIVNKWKINATNFEIRVIVKDSNGTTYHSDPINVTPYPAFVPSIKISESTNNSINITWNKPPDAIFNDTESYEITVAGKKGRTNSLKLFKIIERLECGKTYSIKVAPCVPDSNGGCLTASEEMKADTKPCEKNISPISRPETSTIVLAIFSLYFLAKYEFN